MSRALGPGQPSVVMTNLHSKTLKRTFPSITFVNRMVIANEKK